MNGSGGGCRTRTIYYTVVYEGSVMLRNTTKTHENFTFDHLAKRQKTGGLLKKRKRDDYYEKTISNLEALCDNKDLITSFKGIFFDELQFIEDIDKISQVFEPTAHLIPKHKNPTDDTYSQDCGEMTIRLSAFLKQHAKSTGNLFESVLEILVYIRSVQTRKKNNYNAELRQKDCNEQFLTPFSNSPRYGIIHDTASSKCCNTDYNDCKDFNFCGLKLRTKQSIARNSEFTELTTKVILEPENDSDRSSSSTTITKIEFWDQNIPKHIKKDDPGLWKSYSILGKKYRPTGVLEHVNAKYLNEATTLLSIFFDLCLMPMKKDMSDNSKKAKLREIATFEWLLQQVSPFVRGTPTNTKILISAILLMHGFKPEFPFGHNDKNCFLSFSCNLDEYLKLWPKNTPYVENDFSLLDGVEVKSSKLKTSKIIIKLMEYYCYCGRMIEAFDILVENDTKEILSALIKKGKWRALEKIIEIIDIMQDSGVLSLAKDYIVKAIQAATPNKYISSSYASCVDMLVQKKWLGINSLKILQCVYHVRYDETFDEIQLDHKAIIKLFKELDEKMNKCLISPAKSFSFFALFKKYRIANIPGAHDTLGGITHLQYRLHNLLKSQLSKLKASQLEYIRWYVEQVVDNKPHALRLVFNSTNKNPCAFADTDMFSDFKQQLNEELRCRNRSIVSYNFSSAV